MEIGSITLAGTRFDNVVAEYEIYPDGSPAIQLWVRSPEGYLEPLATASVWVEGLGPDEVAIKDYSENTGVLSSLLSAGLIRPQDKVRDVSSGFVTIPVYKATHDFFKPRDTATQAAERSREATARADEAARKGPR